MSSPSQTTIHYISCIASGGKTHAARQWTIEKLQQNKQLNAIFCLPTTDCTTEVYKDFLEDTHSTGIKVYRIDSDTHDEIHGSVQSQLQHALNQTHEQRIIICTHESLITLLPRCHYTPDEYMLVIDEQLKVIDGAPMKSKYLQAFHDHFDIDGDVVSIKPGKERDIELASFQSHEDPMMNVPWMARFCRYHQHPSYNLTTTVHSNKETGAVTCIEYIALLKTDIIQGFHSVTVLSALFEQSIMYLVWQTMGITFVPDKALSATVRRHQHSNGECLTIHCVQNKYEWKTFRFDKNIQIKACKEIIRSIHNREDVSPEDILFRHKGATKSLSRATLLSGWAYGINHHDHIRHVIYLPTIMPFPHVSQWLEQQGITKKQIRAAWYHLDAYQAVMRCYLRHDKTDKPVHIYLGDAGVSEFIQQQFSGSTIIDKPLVCLKEIVEKENKRPPLEAKHRKLLHDRKAVFKAQGIEVDQDKDRELLHRLLLSRDDWQTVRQAFIDKHDLLYECLVN